MYIEAQSSDLLNPMPDLIEAFVGECSEGSTKGDRARNQVQIVAAFEEGY